jgi:hypothetical protein
MTDVEFNKETAILEAWRVQEHGILQRNSDKSPLVSFIGTNTVGNKEEFVGILYDGPSENAEWGNCWSGVRWCGRRWSCVHDWEGKDWITQEIMMLFLFWQPRKWEEIIIQFQEARPMQIQNLVSPEEVGGYLEGFNGVKPSNASLLEWVSRYQFV